jgi:hypothetical protein
VSVNDQVLPVPSSSAIFKPLPEGGVLFSTSTEVYFGVNGVGARIWELLPPKTHTFGELCEELARQYTDVDASVIRSDARRYLDELLENGLVEFRKDAGTGGANLDTAPKTR